jgi:hypothetical protein
LRFFFPLWINYFRAKLIDNLRSIEGAPSVAQFKIPPDHVMNEVHEDDLDPDSRRHGMTVI